MPFSRYSFTLRSTLILLTPKARQISAWLALPLIYNWLVNMRKLCISSRACVNTGRLP